MQAEKDRQDRLFGEAIAANGPALGRLARAYEADPDLRRDLEQDIQIALWRSFARFEQQCSLRTWTFRIAHNRATSHMVQHRRRNRAAQVSIEDLELAADGPDPEGQASAQQALELIRRLIAALQPPDRQILLLYLEDTSMAEIAEITGVAPATVSSKIHRFKAHLRQRFAAGEE